MNKIKWQIKLLAIEHCHIRPSLTSFRLLIIDVEPAATTLYLRVPGRMSC